MAIELQDSAECLQSQGSQNPSTFKALYHEFSICAAGLLCLSALRICQLCDFDLRKKRQELFIILPSNNIKCLTDLII